LVRTGSVTESSQFLSGLKVYGRLAGRKNGNERVNCAEKDKSGQCGKVVVE